MADIDEVKPTHPALPARRIEKDKRRRDVEEQKPRKQPSIFITGSSAKN